MESCWLFLSERLPLPLRGRHQVIGSATQVTGRVDHCRENNYLVSLVLVAGPERDDTPVFVNPDFIVAVLPIGSE